MKGIIYYTNNLCEERIALACQGQLKKSGLPIISVSQYPMNFGENIVVSFKSGKVSMFKQMVVALEKSSADIIYHCEHDVLYHPSHFELDVEDRNSYHFNTNVWTLDKKTGKALWFNDPGCVGRKMTSGLFGCRDLLLEHFRKKLELIKTEGWSHKKLGFAPGKPAVDNNCTVLCMSEYPNIDIKHGKNITKGRFDLSEFRRRRRIEGSWEIQGSIPYWGRTEGYFDSFLRTVSLRNATE